MYLGLKQEDLAVDENACKVIILKGLWDSSGLSSFSYSYVPVNQDEKIGYIPSTRQLRNRKLYEK